MKCQKRDEAVLAQELRTIEKQEKRIREGKIHFEETFSPLLLVGKHGQATNRIGKSRKNEAIRQQAQADFRSIVRSMSTKHVSLSTRGMTLKGTNKEQESSSKQSIKSKYVFNPVSSKM